MKRKLCPYVNGICEDLRTNLVSGYCFIIEGSCEDVLDYRNCEYYKFKLREKKKNVLLRK